MPSQKHIHTYAKYKGKPGYYKCNSPDCTHFAQRNLIEGKFSLCNLCGTQFTLTFYDLDQAYPRCLNCSNTKKARQARKAKELTRYLGTDAFEQQSGILPFSDLDVWPGTTSLEEEGGEEAEE